MSQHTPGPWFMSVGDDSDDWANWFPIIVAEGCNIVGTEGFYIGDRDIDIANATLAAAAPDLLAVADMVLATATCHTDPALVAAATDAIRKAKGDTA